MNDIKNFSGSGITKIKDVNILDTPDFVIVNELSTELQETFTKKQIYRTDTEMRYSVLNDVKFPTLASKYWQSVREQDVMFTNLIYLACDYEKEQGELELLECDLLEITKHDKRSRALRKIKKAEIKRKQFKLMQMRLEAKDRVREIKLWEKIKIELKTHGKFNLDDVNDHQLESYTIRWKKEMDLGKESGNADLYKNSKSQLETLTLNKKELKA